MFNMHFNITVAELKLSIGERQKNEVRAKKRLRLRFFTLSVGCFSWTYVIILEFLILICYFFDLSAKQFILEFKLSLKQKLELIPVHWSHVCMLTFPAAPPSGRLQFFCPLIVNQSPVFWSVVIDQEAAGNAIRSCLCVHVSSQSDSLNVCSCVV